MILRIFGPNLSHAGQRKGDMHVHAEGCGDCAHYGPGTKYGGDDNCGWRIEAASAKEVAHAIYPPGEFDYDPETEWEIYADCYYAPCVKFPKEV